jgi:hypothetical protein
VLRSPREPKDPLWIINARAARVGTVQIALPAATSCRGRRFGRDFDQEDINVQPAAQTPPAQLDPGRWSTLALLCGAFFMVSLDANIVIVAVPSIDGDLGFSDQGLQWVISAYALTFAGLLLLGGRAADLLG